MKFNADLLLYYYFVHILYTNYSRNCKDRMDNFENIELYFIPSDALLILINKKDIRYDLIYILF